VGSPNESWIADALSRYERPLLRYAAWLLNDRDHARDVVQEVFLRLCKEQPDRVADHVAEWLFTVCRNLSLDVRERDQRRRRLDETQELRVSNIAAAYGAGPAERAHLLRQILGMIETLPGNQREAVFLKFYQGFTYKEISELTGLSVSNVGFLIHTAVHSIRERVRSGDSPARLSPRRLS